MERFFFDLWDSNAFVPDPNGIALPDLAAAREEALKSARAILDQGRANGEDRSGWVFEIKNSSYETVLKMPFTEALKSQ